MLIKQDAVTGKAEAIDGKPFVVAREKNANEVANHVSVRRVKFFTENVSKPISDTTARKTHATWKTYTSKPLRI